MPGLPTKIFIYLVLALGLAGASRAESVAWRIDAERSVIEVGVKSRFDRFQCRVARFEAHLTMERGTQRVEQAVVTFALADVKTGRERRDVDLLEWSGAVGNPTLSFRLSEMETLAGGKLMARGTVTMHGVEKAISFPVRSLVEGLLHTFDGKAEIDYRDFGLPVIRKFYFLTVNPRLEVRFHLQGWLDRAGPQPVRLGGILIYSERRGEAPFDQA